MRPLPLPALRRLLPLVLLLGLLAPGPAPAEEPGTPAEALARVRTAETGFLRVPAAALRALGFGDDDHLEVSRRGVPVPVCRSRVGDDPVFLALPESPPAPRPRTYVLRRGAAAPRPPARAASGAPLPPPELARPQVTRPGAPATRFEEQAAAEREVYDVAAPTWHAARLARGGDLRVPLPADAPAGSSQRLRVRVHGNHPGEVALEASFAGRALGRRAALRTQGGAEFVWDLVDVVAGEALVLSDRSRVPAPPPSDVSEGRGEVAVVSIVWEGVAEPTLGEALVSWPAAPRPCAFRHPATLPDPWLLQVAADGRAAEPVTLTRAGDVVAVESPAAADGARVYAARDAREVLPERRPPPPDVLAQAAGAEHVIVSTTDLLPEAQRLAAHRRAQGLASVAVPAREVYEAYAEGEPDPQALRAFLLRLRERREGPPLRYVLLAGDALRDRADLATAGAPGLETLPVLLARTIYNGATPADALFVERERDSGVGAPVVGRLPFRTRAEAAAFVERLIAYETRPPVDATRGRVDFLANEARFGPLIDRLIESFFRGVVTRMIPAEMEVGLTFASATSPFLWPPREFGAKVLDDINRGALFYTYVGHGFAQGFDSLQIGAERHGVLHLSDVPRVDIRGTPPVLFAIACTTAEFDHPARTGLGEALLARPRGPIAYVGATRICHPAGNVFLGRSLARAMFRAGTAGARRLGDVLARARDEVLDPSNDDRTELSMVTAGALLALPPGSSLERLKREALWLYNLLGDPATRLALPDLALGVEAARAGEDVEVAVTGAPEGAVVEVRLVLPRDRMHPGRPITRGLAPLDRGASEAIRTNHAHANDKVLRRARGTVEGGRARVRLVPAPGDAALDDPRLGGALHVTAFCATDAQVGLGGQLLVITPNSPDGAAPPR